MNPVYSRTNSEHFDVSSIHHPRPDRSAMCPLNGIRRPQPALLEELRSRIRRLERDGAGRSAEDGDPLGFPDVLPLDVPEIDGALPWGGLPRAALHEVIGEDGAASGFCAAVLARFAGERGAVLWCRRKQGLYGPGLVGLGLDTRRLIVVRGRAETDVLWAMEEGLRSGGLAAVIGEADRATSIALRRLQLAAESGGVTAVLLRSRHGEGVASPAVTRWRVTAASEIPAKAYRAASFPFAETAAVCWRVELLNRRNVSGLAKTVGTSSCLPRTWLVEWHDGATGGFRVVADLRDRPPAAAAKPAARLAV